jgi:hypothetical protein
MAIHPTPNFNTTVGLISHANTLTEGWLTTFFLIAGFVIIGVTLRANMYKKSDSWLIASFLTFIFSALFFAAGLVADKIVIIFLILSGLCGLWSLLEH